MDTLRNFYSLARPFWGDKKNWRAWLLLLSIIGLGLVLVRMNVWFSFWNKEFYDALAALDTDKIYPLLGQYCLLIAGAVLVAVYVDWLRKLLILRWREALTASLISQWLQHHAFYRLGLQNEPDNPDQRIAEDANLLVTDSLDILRSFINAVAKIVSFVGMLWVMSSQLMLPWNGQDLHIPGYLVWFSLGYALLGAVITHAIGKRLFQLNWEQQRSEASFRASLLRKRDHAEQIALYGGEAREQQHLLHQFRSIASNWVALMNRERMLGFFTVGYNRANSMVPLFAAMPAFLHKSISFGDMMQISTAFMQVSTAMSWFVQAYDELAKLSATIQRLAQFQRAIGSEHQQWKPPSTAPQLRTNALVVHKPNGMALLAPTTLCAQAGQWLHLHGPSGLGKSTLLRTLSGIWPYYQGHYNTHAGRTLLLPQQPYLPEDSLRALLQYPAPSSTVVDSAILHRALSLVGLAHLHDHLETHQEWQRVLSGGEQQRLSIARALVYQPDCLLLDEATSQLDETASLQLMHTLRQQLPQCAVLAITHQTVLHPVFDERISLQPASTQGH
ncbi:ABC transporter ATP-binding protein/permease [Curvibacter sp. CHRR-16]|uniref:ABC transporter ATP-binding protein/permease n=1 Tax=Curvibacter sp. CHRR-16 TaxID=2835872 RepID=UPI001BDA30BC|nr:ABC transporter ATP-binding protein/permease [Curvibacter sp. CHRR-16]MBT0571332.1 ABC transporter ATP-binding protein/permease [Curvibacter sp. CHRR-16]